MAPVQVIHIDHNQFEAVDFSWSSGSQESVEHFKILLKKEAYKFSSTHFTVFGPDEAERLHGHNYAVEVTCEANSLNELGMAFEFNSLKRHIKQTADAWDEFVLIPVTNPYIKILNETVHSIPHTVVEFAKRSYRFPESEVVQLNVSNITSEELAKLFWFKLEKSWMSNLSEEAKANLKQRLTWMEVSIEETSGQRAAFRKEIGANLKIRDLE